MMVDASNTVSVLSASSFNKIKAGVFDGPQIHALVRDQSCQKDEWEEKRGLVFVCGGYITPSQ